MNQETPKDDRHGVRFILVPEKPIHLHHPPNELLEQYHYKKDTLEHYLGKIRPVIRFGQLDDGGLFPHKYGHLYYITVRDLMNANFLHAPTNDDLSGNPKPTKIACDLAKLSRVSMQFTNGYYDHMGGTYRLEPRVIEAVKQIPPQLIDVVDAFETIPTRCWLGEADVILYRQVDLKKEIPEP